MDNDHTMHCPHCHKYTAISIVKAKILSDRSTRETQYRFVDLIWRKDKDTAWWIGKCNSCSEPVLVKNRTQEIYPHPMPSATSGHIPSQIRDDIAEAKKCLSVSAWNATVVMCRRAIESTCVDKGAKNGNLKTKIDYLVSEGYITKGLGETASVVRWIGNNGAHSETTMIDQDTALHAVQFTEGILNTIYDIPAKTEIQRGKLGK